ncbi:hypothetical protein TSUD_100760 [Trifolium subterraneum]|uniref:Uncharacterized protein n=1 Tax=Trifolium subterraneum TaxID=3900 RepID=A0A2Z6PGF8_TRISU|nr:hypothetical protein TSUD_100760 [Trifolium subterraneum]
MLRWLFIIWEELSSKGSIGDGDSVMAVAEGILEEESDGDWSESRDALLASGECSREASTTEEGTEGRLEIVHAAVYLVIEDEALITRSQAAKEGEVSKGVYNVIKLVKNSD